MSVSPSQPVAFEPATWTIVVRRSEAAPNEVPLQCAFFNGEGGSPSLADADMLARVRNDTVATLGAGSDTAVCTITTIYTSAGVKTRERAYGT